MTMGPFSVGEFGDLVALALETEGRFSESQLQFDPELLRRTTGATEGIKPSSHHVAVRSLTMPAAPTSAWAASPVSRPRLLLNKIKHKASALVLRTPAKPAKPTSFFDDEPPACRLFAPYLPLAAQFERAKSSRAIFSRPASLVTAPPPSPTASSSSSACASPVTPTTDLFASASRWSLSTDESTTSFSYPNHPFASTHDVADPDPFAKGHVQVIRNSADYPSYTYAFSRRHSAKRRSQPRPSPSAHALPRTPPPDWTLALPSTPPTTPSRSFLSHSPSSSSSSSDSQCPSAWNPSPPSTPRTRRKTRVSTLPHPPSIADSTASTGTLVLTPKERDRERARALAVLTRRGEVHPSALEVFASTSSAAQKKKEKEKEDRLSLRSADSESGTFYSARSSVRQSLVSAFGGGGRVRADSGVRGVGC
ncbi:hypothetical protein C0995_001072 [Termitomyces sp. Mi166|nr:hypothetical protein C0995_001072 [Termitomyces sp. Mi166\